MAKKKSSRFNKFKSDAPGTRLTVIIDPDLKDLFLETAYLLDSDGSKETRKFTIDYLRRNKVAAQRIARELDIPPEKLALWLPD